MRFYTKTHKHYCGIDLHAKKMYVCIIDGEGKILVHCNINCNPAEFLRAIAPYREGLVVGVECMFAWYWLSNLCREEKIELVLGHALYMRATTLLRYLHKCPRHVLWPLGRSPLRCWSC
jgi:hypothetical protein